MTRTPPRLAEALLRRFGPSGLAGEGLLGDLREEMQRRGRAWYWRQAITVTLRYATTRRYTAPPNIARSIRRGDHVGSTIWQDTRYALRTLRRQPGFAAVAISTLAIGIGANTAIFSVVNGVLLRPLGFVEPDRLVHILGTRDGDPGRGTISYPNYADIRERSGTWAGAAAFDEWQPTLLDAGEPERLEAASVNASYFTVLGVGPALGRFFVPDEDLPGHDPVVVLSYGLWQRRFGGRADIVGRTINLSETPYEVVGVAPAGLEDPQLQGIRWGAPQVWRATPAYFATNPRGARSFTAIARLRPGVTLAAAQAEIDGLYQQLAADYPDENTNRGMLLRPLKEQIVGPVRTALVVLLLSVALVLLIACVNVANLTLSRSAGRRREIAVRTAVGAGRGRLAGQLITESLVLAVLGGGLGVVLAWLGTATLVGLAGDSMPRAALVRIDGSVLAFTMGVSVLTGLLFGFAPAARASQANVIEALREGGRAGAGAGTRRMRDGLVIAEIALSLVLVTTAGLLLKSLWRLQRVDAGLDPDVVLVAGIAPSAARYPDAASRERLYGALRERLAALPGVEAVGAVDILPMSGGFNGNLVTRDDRPQPTIEERRSAETRFVTPGYFAAMGVALRRGRAFTTADRADGPRVVVVNESFAREFYGDEDPLGAHITFYSLSWEIVGVVEDVRQFGLDTDVGSAVYAPYAQTAFTVAMNLVIRTTSPPAELAPAVRGAVWEIDATAPIYALTPMRTVVSETVAQPRFRAVLLAIFAAVALLLATVGIAGVMAYTVSQRIAEMGLRIALGAQRSDVVRLVLGRSATLTAAGVFLGLGGAVATARALRSLVFGVSTTDAATLAAGALLLAAVSIAAAYLPARRAGTVDPMIALRAE